MMGSLSEAEDAVQKSSLRLSRADTSCAGDLERVRHLVRARHGVADGLVGQFRLAHAR